MSGVGAPRHIPGREFPFRSSGGRWVRVSLDSKLMAMFVAYTFPTLAL